MYLKEGFDDYLSKPINSTLLEQIIMQYLPKDKIKNEETEKENTNQAVNQMNEYLIKNKKLLYDNCINSNNDNINYIYFYWSRFNK